MAGRGVLNGDGDQPRDLFGVALPDGTGAPGSQGVVASDKAGPVVGNPVVSAPYGSSQLPENRPRLDVTAGDTSSMSDDMPAHEDAIMAGPVADYLSTGAGDGSADHWKRYPGQEKPS